MTALVLRADAARLPLPDASVDLIVTSPPYFALRSYQDGGEHYAGQIGSEASPQEFLDALWTCTREWMRVLKPSGSLFVNLGDSYYSGKGAPGRTTIDDKSEARTARRLGGNPLDGPSFGIGRKSLLGMPWRYAIGCIDSLGLILRAEIVWAKPNGLPESVTDRVRRSHENWFHFTLQPRYFAAVDEIREPHARLWDERNGGSYGRATTKDDPTRGSGATHRGSTPYPMPNPLGKLPGSVWEIPSEPLTVPAHLGVDHFAAFPTAWPKRLISGWSPSGICTACGEGRRPVAATTGMDMSRPQARRAAALVEQHGLTDEHIAAVRSVGTSDVGRGAATQTGTGKNTAAVYELAVEARTVLGGYAREFLLQRPTSLGYACACPDATAPTRPSVILDPFGGTGTTAAVASALGRIGISVDLSHDYSRLAQWRTAEGKLRARIRGEREPVVQVDGQLGLDIDGVAV